MATPPNYIDLARQQRLAINSRLSFNSVVNGGSPASQNVALPTPTPTVTPTPTPTPSPTTTITPTPTPTPTPTFLPAMRVAGAYDFEFLTYGLFDGTYTLSGTSSDGTPKYQNNKSTGATHRRYLMYYTTYFGINRYLISRLEDIPSYTFVALTSGSSINVPASGRYQNVEGYIQDAYAEPGQYYYAVTVSAADPAITLFNATYTKKLSTGANPQVVYRYFSSAGTAVYIPCLVYDCTTQTWVFSSVAGDVLCYNALTGYDNYTGTASAYGNQFLPPLSGNYRYIDGTPISLTFTPTAFR